MAGRHLAGLAWVNPWWVWLATEARHGDGVPSEAGVSGWVEVVPRCALAGGSALEAEAGRTALLLYDVGGAVYATAAVCPHHAAWLSQGSVAGDLVNCPRHQGQFHIPTGRKTRGPQCADLRTYPTAVRDGVIWVDMGGTAR